MIQTGPMPERTRMRCRLFDDDEESLVGAALLEGVDPVLKRLSTWRTPRSNG